MGQQTQGTFPKRTPKKENGQTRMNMKCVSWQSRDRDKDGFYGFYLRSHFLLTSRDK
jgi:hypothetical protein